MNLENVWIIYKPSAENTRQVNELVGLLHGVPVTVKATTPEPDSAMQLAAEAAADGLNNDKPPPLILFCGGDGTVNGGINGVASVPNSKAVIGVLGLGTGNLLHKAFNEKQTPAQLVAMLRSGEPQDIDAVELTYTDLKGVERKRLFMVALGLGKASDAISEASPFMKKLLGKFFYFLRVCLACLVPNSRKFTISRPGRPDEVKTAAVVFALNAVPPQYLWLSRGCSGTDHKVDVGAFEGTTVWHLLKIVACLAFGRPEKSQRYTRVRTSEVTIRADAPVKPNIDGDPGEPTRELHLRVLPGAVRMIVSP